MAALSNWRLGILLMLFAGGLQDPVRKMMPEAPVWMVMAFVPVLVAILFKVFLAGQSPWAGFLRTYPRLRPAIQFFAVSLLLALLVLLTKHGVGVWKVGAIGLIGYLFPLLAIVLGFVYVRTPDDLLRFVRVYCVLTAVLLIGGLLEHWQVFPEWPALGTGALDTVWIRHVHGYIVQLTSGFYRSPDLLGWHAGSLVMFSLLMVFYSSKYGHRAFWLLIASWGATILIISGRNKMIFMPPIFLAVVGIAYLYKGNVNKLLTASVTSLLSLGILFAFNQQLQFDEEYLEYVELGSGNSALRLKQQGFDALVITFKQSGLLGEGLGSASTGSRYGGTGTIGTWQESGSSKLMVELGVTGLLAAILLVAALSRILWKVLRWMPLNARYGVLFIGFLGILAANGASFMISHQAFGDPFLVTLAGFFIGIALSAPRWAFSAPENRSLSGSA